MDKEASLSTKVAKAAGIVLLMNLLSRFLGFVRDAVIAKEFGASGATDAYLVAYTLPYALQAVLGMAFVSVIVPLITAYLVKGEKQEAWKITSILFNWTAVILTLLTLLGIALAPLLISLLAPGFEPETYKLTVSLTRIIFPSIIFMGTGMLITGVLNASGVFAIPAFAPGLANIVVILSVIIFAEQFRVQGLAAGTLASFVAFFLIQVPYLKKLGFKWKWDWNKGHPAVKKAGAVLFPITFSIAINQIYLAVNRIFASGLEPGSITALDFAYRLMALPLGIFVAAIATAIFPAFSRYAAQDDKAGLANSLVSGMAMVSLIAIPSAAGLMALREPLIQAVFQRGAFDAYATERTAVALWYFSLGLWAVGANTVVTRAYYAMNNIKTPLALGLFSAALNVLFSIMLMPYLGHGGLALANSLSALVNIVLLFVFLGKHLPQMSVSKLLVPIVKAVFAAGLMGLAVNLALPYTAALAGSLKIFGFLALVSQLAVLTILGGGLYALLLIFLKTNELQMIKRALFRK
ncbi:MAG: murein biosynthesis integral membrane protein MurJ [Bacillota bacterium]